MRKRFVATVLVCLSLLASSALAGQILRFGIETSRTDSQYHGAQVFANHVKEKTNGAIEIRLFPDSALGTTASQINQVRSGTLDITLTGSGNFAGMIEALNVFDVPFLFKDSAHVDRVMDGPIGRAIMDDCEEFDIKGLSLWENGFRSLTNSRNPARLPADVKGLKIRVPAMPMHVEAWRLLGANPIPMNYSEVFTALETRAIDAQDHPIAITFSSRFYESQKYLSVTHHAYTPLILVINLNRFKSFTPEQQQIILDGALLGAKAQRKFVRDNEDNFIEKIREYGVEVIYRKDLDMQPWADMIMDGMLKFLSEKPKAMQWLKPIQEEGDK